MKFFHLSDLHIGKRVNEFSMLEDQTHILGEILEKVDEEKPEAVLISGDVYDKTVPSAEAVQLFDWFLVELSQRERRVFLISGNHDSAERVAFGNRLMSQSKVHVSPVYNGKIEPLRMEDAYGPINFYLLPFLKPVQIRRYYPEKELESYTEALAFVVEEMKLAEKERNILLAHQFVTGGTRCESEELSVGGTDQVDGSIFEAFDYVALGHLHGPQNVGVHEKTGTPKLRYCGTPLKYSFSEVHHKKSITVVEMFEKGNLEFRTIPLTPLRDMKEIKGTYMELTNRNYYHSFSLEDYFHITLTDEEDIPDAIGKLRSIYKNLMRLDYDNTRTRGTGNLLGAEGVEKKSPLELFSEFYEKQNDQPLSDFQKSYLLDKIEQIWEDKA